MSAIVGGLMTCGGFLKMFDVLGRPTNYLNKDIHVAAQQNDTKCKRICRIAAAIFTMIGHCCIGLGMMTMGTTLYSASATIPFLTALNAGLTASAHHIICSLGGLSFGLILRQAAL